MTRALRVGGLFVLFALCLAKQALCADTACPEGKIRAYQDECTEGTGDVLFLLDASTPARGAFPKQLVRIYCAAPPLFEATSDSFHAQKVKKKGENNFVG